MIASDGKAMKPATLKALKQSIAHWRRLATGKEKQWEEPNAEHCALCTRFLKSALCYGCPVKERSGKRECNGTPYVDAYHAWSAWKWNEDEQLEPAFRTAAKKQLAFLESLLPKKPRKKATK